MGLVDPIKEAYTVLTFTQDGTDRVYTTWSEEPFATPGATLIPQMSVKIPPNTGTLDEKPLTVELPSGVDAWLDGLADGSPQAAVVVAVEERFKVLGPIVTGVGCGADYVGLGTYRLVRAIRNPERRPGLIRLEFLGEKSRLNVPLGIPVNPTCAWTLGDKTCQATVTAENPTITAISRKKITTSDAGGVIAGKTTGYWRFGTATVAGLTLGIRAWEAGTTDFELVREPPASWAGATVAIKPGCDKSAATCASRFSNLERFGGFGVKVPSFQPVLETP